MAGLEPYLATAGIEQLVRVSGRWSDSMPIDILGVARQPRIGDVRMPARPRRVEPQS